MKGNKMNEMENIIKTVLTYLYGKYADNHIKEYVNFFGCLDNLTIEKFNEKIGDFRTYQEINLFIKQEEEAKKWAIMSLKH